MRFPRLVRNWVIVVLSSGCGGSGHGSPTEGCLGPFALPATPCSRQLGSERLGPEALAVTRSPPKSKLSNFTVTFMAHGVSSPSRGALKQSGNGHGAQAYLRSEERPPGKATAPNSDLTGPSSSAPEGDGRSSNLSLSLSLCRCVGLVAG